MSLNWLFRYHIRNQGFLTQNEFAKRFRVKDLTVDLSPVSVRALMNAFHPYLMLMGRWLFMFTNDILVNGFQLCAVLQVLVLKLLALLDTLEV